MIIVGVYTLVTVTAILGNLLVILSYIFNRFVRSKMANVFILNLSISDFLVGSVVMFCDVLVIILGRWPFGNVACSIWLSTHYFAINMSIVTICVISIDRLFLVSDVLKYRRNESNVTSLCIVAGVWIYSVFFTALYATTTEDITYPTQRRGGELRCLVATQNAHNMFISVMLENLDFAVPLLLIIVINVTVAFKVHRKLNNPKLNTSHSTQRALNTLGSRSKFYEVSSQHDNGFVNVSYIGDSCDRLSHHQDDRNEGNHKIDGVRGNGSMETSILATEWMSFASDISNKLQRNTKRKIKGPKQEECCKAAKSLIVLTSVYISCWLPFHILVFLQSWKIFEAEETIWEILQRLTWFNSVINPFLYAKMNIRYRLGILKILCFRKNYQIRINRLTNTL
ncbi:Histamine H4 receptor [Holothuria leucospilota]|uniref:Histamine H4 receptor n=1 Tax=Holothuria leucospilota TaxID=206669 RepID=A0A9Q1CIW4_HOLLE|nr:Histamine H4 receptor [Holothuria leucospilota]